MYAMYIYVALFLAAAQGKILISIGCTIILENQEAVDSLCIFPDCSEKGKMEKKFGKLNV